MAGTVGINPVPAAATYDPMGHGLTEEQKARLREIPAPPIEEALAKQRLADRRREEKREQQQRQRDDDDKGPGAIIDSYA